MIPVEEHATTNASTVTGSQSRGPWLNVLTHLDPKFGGLSAVVPPLAAAVKAAGTFATEIDVFCAPDEEYPDKTELGATPLRSWPMNRRRWITDRALRERFQEMVAQASGLHIHGLWEQSTMSAASAARALGRPYIISAHGMLERWALANKGLKKKIYGRMFERAHIEGATCLHALTLAEAEDYRRFGSQRPIAIIPNGVEVPQSIDRHAFRQSFPVLQGRRYVLFLGRIHFKKGLDLLVDAWSQISARYPDAMLVIAGPDFEGTRQTVEGRIAGLGIANRIVFTGMLTGGMKWSALASATCFVLPSYSEGLSVSTLEAMGVGVPVIVTEQCNLPEVQNSGAGWQIQSKVAALSLALQECLEKSEVENLRIGERGRSLVRDRYSWTAVGAQMSDLYRWVLEGGPAPRSLMIQAFVPAGNRKA